MKPEQIKIALLLIGSLALGAFFMAIGNEIDLLALEAKYEALLPEHDSLEVRLQCEEVGLYWYEVTYGRTEYDTTFTD